MAAYDDPRFRPTLWPGVTVPVPPLSPVAEIEVDGDWITWSPIANARQRLGSAKHQVQLPEDFYLRELRELSAEDLSGVAEIFRSYGLLYDLNLDDFPVHDYLPEDFQPYLDKAEQQPPSASVFRIGVHRDIVALYLDTAQEAITTWLACKRERGLEELVAPSLESDYESLAAELAGDGALPTREEVRDVLIASRLLTLDSVVSAALSAYSIGLKGLEQRRTSVYSACFLQMYNHMVEGAHARQCANETCRRLFVRQRGRAAYGQHRTHGVLYCSNTCARAQAARQHRRKLRQQRTGQG